MNATDLKALLLATDLADLQLLIDKLKAGRKSPDLDTFRKQYYPAGHDSMDITKRPDKKAKKPNSDGKPVEVTVKVNRLNLSLQKIITKRAVSFLFGNPVKINAEPKSDKQQLVLDALNRILHDNKINSFNRRVALDLFRSTEVAECWFVVNKAEKHTDYGFSTEKKIRVVHFSPWDGNDLYPLFDDTGDLIAFSRQYVRTDENDKAINFFETYTAEEVIRWKSGGSSAWEQISREPHTLGKIPVVYAHQEEVEWADVQVAIDRLEYLMSNFADTNDYHAAPKIFVEGQLEGFADKGESGGILQGKNGAKAYYLSWDHATDAVKLEIETLLRFIYSFTQTPDISFDSVKGLREISGEALKMLFLDAHLKVQEKREVFDEYLQRRINLIKTFIGTANLDIKTDASTLEIEADIQPFIINDTKAMIEMLTSANGGKAMISQKSAIAQAGLVDDVETEYALIQAEEKTRNTIDITDPAI